MIDRPEDSTELGARLAAEERGFEESFRRDYPLIWLLTLVGPFALTAAVLVLIGMWAGWRYLRDVIVAALSSFFFAGKFVILAGGEGHIASTEQFNALPLFIMVFYMDLMTATLLVFHTGFLYKLPVIGSKLLQLVEDGHYILATNPWMKRVTFIGLIAFIMFPLAATGSVGGSIFARLLGMSRLAALLAISIGSLLGCGLMYFGAGLITKFFDRDNPLFLVGGGVVIVVLIVLLNQRYRRLKALHRAEEQRQRTLREKEQKNQQRAG